MSFIVRPLPWQPSVLTKAEKKPLGFRSPNFDCIFTQTASLQRWGMSDPPVAETSLSPISRKKPNKLNQPETEPPVLANACPCFHAQLMKTTWQLAGQYRDVPSCSAASTSHHATSFSDYCHVVLPSQSQKEYSSFLNPSAMFDLKHAGTLIKV